MRQIAIYLPPLASLFKLTIFPLSKITASLLNPLFLSHCKIISLSKVNFGHHPPSLLVLTLPSLSKSSSKLSLSKLTSISLRQFAWAYFFTLQKISLLLSLLLSLCWPSPLPASVSDKQINEFRSIGREHPEPLGRLPD